MYVACSTIPRLISVIHRVSLCGKRITYPIVLILCMHEYTCMCECGGKYGYLGVYVGGAMVGHVCVHVHVHVGTYTSTWGVRVMYDGVCGTWSHMCRV